MRPILHEAQVNILLYSMLNTCDGGYQTILIPDYL